MIPERPQRLQRFVGMGCMRLSEVDDSVARATLAAGIDAGIGLLDTAASYGPEGQPHHNERLVAGVLADRAPGERPLVVTKAGMRRGGGRWRPAGTRKAILADAAASAEALGAPPDVSLLHLPDPAVPLATSVRALAAAREAGLTRSVGLSNITLGQLEEARGLTEIALVELPMGPFDDAAVRGGVVERCLELSIPVLAHAPLGGPSRHRRLERDEDLQWLAESHGVTPQTIVLAWLYGFHPLLTPIPGPRRPETARLCAMAASLPLRDDERALLDDRFELGRLLRTPRRDRAVRRSEREVVLFVGIPGAGKTSAARELVQEGHLRLSRDERGGTLRQLTRAMGELLDEGEQRILLDATFPTRVGRNRVLETAWERGVRVRCIHFDTPLEEAQINAVDRMLARCGELLEGEALKRAGKKDPNLFPPRAQYGFRDRFEPPHEDEGFALIERRPFERQPIPGHDAPGLLIDLGALIAPERWRAGEPIELARLEPLLRPGVPTLVLAWLPGEGRGEAELRDELRALAPAVEVAVCAHPPGPARCWCRPPLPGLPVAWLRRRGIAPAKVTHLGAGPASERLAEALGFLYRPTTPTATRIAPQ